MTDTQAAQRTPVWRTRLGGAVAAVAIAGLAAPALAHASGAAGPEPAPKPCVGPAPTELQGWGEHDMGPNPAAININSKTVNNQAYRDTLWTGDNLQLTVMSIQPKDDIGLEAHTSLDQFIRIEDGTGLVKMGSGPKSLKYVKRVNQDSAIIIPAGTWHDVINTGDKPLKLYSIYAKPNHPRDTYHWTKKDAAADPLEKQKCPQDLEAPSGS